MKNKFQEVAKKYRSKKGLYTETVEDIFKELKHISSKLDEIEYWVSKNA